MEMIKLPGTDLNVSRLCFGTMTFGKQASEAESIRLVETAVGGGINFFDTANVYNAGASEMLLGKALGSRRKHVIVASKVRGSMGDRPEDVGLSRAAIHKAIEASLSRLGTDYLDLYYLHMPDYNVPVEETLEVMDGLVKSGKVRYVASQSSMLVSTCNGFRKRNSRASGCTWARRLASVPKPDLAALRFPQ